MSCCYGRYHIVMKPIQHPKGKFNLVVQRNKRDISMRQRQKKTGLNIDCQASIAAHATHRRFKRRSTRRARVLTGAIVAMCRRPGGRYRTASAQKSRSAGNNGAQYTTWCMMNYVNRRSTHDLYVGCLLIGFHISGRHVGNGQMQE